MKVTVLEPYGYCAGVELAINLALKTKKENATKNVVVLGMLVHNEDTLKTLEYYGIKTIFEANSSLEELVELIKEPSIVILTAHGHKKSIEEKLLNRGHIIVDATCPFVNKSFDLIKNAISKDKKVFYIGIQNHPESNAALSLSKNVFLIDAKNVKIPNVDCDSPLVISQTTMSKYEITNILNLVKKAYPNAEFVEGICNASTSRQNALISLQETPDKIYIVGGKHSNNSKTLFNLAKNKFPNSNVELIQNAGDINKKDLIGLSHIAISSGASTPKEIIEKIKDKLLN